MKWLLALWLRVRGPKPRPWSEHPEWGGRTRLLPGGKVNEIRVEVDLGPLSASLERFTRSLEAARDAWEALPPDARRAAGTVTLTFGDSDPPEVPMGPEDMPRT